MFRIILLFLYKVHTGTTHIYKKAKVIYDTPDKDIHLEPKH